MRSILSLMTLLLPLAAALPAVPGHDKPKPKYYRKYSVKAYAKYFKQDLHDYKRFEPLQHQGLMGIKDNFGLRNFDYDGLNDWQVMMRGLDVVNRQAGPRTHFKLLFLQRHSQAWHDAAIDYYDEDMWNFQMSKHVGNATAFWADGDLTPAGKAQTKELSLLWEYQMKFKQTPYPQVFYVAPSQYSCRTAQLVHGGIPTPQHREPFAPVIKESLRPRVTHATMTQRRAKSEIARMFPNFQFEEDFPAQDEMWFNNHVEETSPEFRRRIARLLSNIWELDDATILGMVVDDTVFNMILDLVGHRAWPPAHGEIVPILLNGTRLDL